MTGNRYLGLANLATHPAFQRTVAALVCPVCGATTTRVGEYNRDFLGHNPDAATAYRWLSGREYDRQQSRRGWPSGEEVSVSPGES